MPGEPRGAAGGSAGERRVRTDPRAKVRGELRYAADQSPQPCLDVVLHRATRPHALIKSIDTGSARSVDGVVAVVTGAQLYQRFGDALMAGPALSDQPCLAVDKVRYVGEPVAAVIARGPAPARRAADRIVVDYAELDAVHDVDTAIAGAPYVHQPPSSIVFGDLEHPRERNTNVNCEFNLRRGDATAATKAGAVTVRQEFWCPPTHHASIDLPFTAAWRDGDGLELVSTTQTPSSVRRSVADLLGIPLSVVRVRCVPLDSSFGATTSDRLEALAAALAWSQQLPVRIAASQEEAILLTTGHGVAVTGSMTADHQGRIVAATADVRYDTGAYADGGPRITADSGSVAPGPYRINNVEVQSRSVYTNKPPAGGFHGFSAPQMAWSHESLVDELARRCGTDLVEFRRRNLLRAGDASPIHSADFVACLDAVAEAISWNSPMERVRGRLRRGRGVAVGATCDTGNAVRRATTLTAKANFTTWWVPYPPETDQSEQVTKHWFAGAAAVQLTVDIATGRVHLEHLAVAGDVGRAINPRLVEQQLKSMALMGVGHALFDQMRDQMVCDFGLVGNGSLLDYQLPSVLDTPDKVTPIIVESPHRTGPYPAAGVCTDLGETALNPLAPAIANAVRDAIDIRIPRLPLTPERILTALAEQEALE